MSIIVPLEHLFSAIEDFGSNIPSVLQNMQHIDETNSLDAMFSKMESIRSLSLITSDGSNVLERLAVAMKHAQIEVVQELKQLQSHIVLEEAPPLDGFRVWRKKLLYSFHSFSHLWLRRVAEILHTRYPGFQVLQVIVSQPAVYLHQGWPQAKIELHRDIEDLRGLYKMLEDHKASSTYFIDWRLANLYSGRHDRVYG